MNINLKPKYHMFFYVMKSPLMHINDLYSEEEFQNAVQEDDSGLHFETHLPNRDQLSTR